MTVLDRKDLLGLEELSRGEIELILDNAVSFKEISERPIKKVPIMRGKTIINLFFEPSTRTRISFELAEKRLSADTTNFSSSSSSVLKGETLLDTARNIEAMMVDMVVMRHSCAGAPHFLANRLDASIINAGDGCHEHPTQGLLDLLTIREKFGSLEGLNVVLVGDIRHSRVARSNIWGLLKLGARPGVIGPATLIPPGLEELDVTIFDTLDDALAEAQVINILRVQKERQSNNFLPSLREYFNYFGITRKRLEFAGADSDLLVMHPGPINRGVEVESVIADGPFSVILNQVTNGVAVRMAVLYLFSGGGKGEE